MARAKLGNVLMSPAAKVPLPALWMDPDYGVSISNTDRVDSWTSRVNPAHVFANTGNARPTWTASGIGGRPSLVFNPAESTHLLYGSPVTTAVIGTLFAVTRFVTSTSVQCVYSQTKGSVSDRRAYFGRRGSTAPAYGAVMLTANTTVKQITTELIAADADCILTLQVPGATGATVHRNGALLSIAGNTNPEWFGSIVGVDSSVVGGAVYGGSPTIVHGGQIAEILMYDRILSTSEILRVHRYLSKKYKIALG